MSVNGGYTARRVLAAIQRHEAAKVEWKASRDEVFKAVGMLWPNRLDTERHILAPDGSVYNVYIGADGQVETGFDRAENIVYVPPEETMPEGAIRDTAADEAAMREE